MAAASKALAYGADSFGIVNSGRGPSDEELDRLGPILQQLAELEGLGVPPGLTGGVGFHVPKLPGAMYVGITSGVSIALQSQLLAARWRKQVVAKAPPYPRFPFLQEALWKAVAALKRLRPGQETPIRVVNMAYVNLIQPKEPRTVLQDYFADQVQLQVVERADPLHEMAISWREGDAIDLRFNLQAATAQLGNEKHSGYRLATVAGFRLGPDDEPERALSLIHARLQRFFHDLISDRAKREWELEVSHGK